jgi:hypothetical protein
MIRTTPGFSVLFIPVILLLVTGAAFGQTGQEPLAVLDNPEEFSYTVASTSEGYERVVAESVELVLNRRGFVQENATTDSGTGDTVPLFWELTVLEALPRLHLAISVIDRRYGTVVTTVTDRAPANLTLYASIDTLVDRVSSGIAQYYRAPGSVAEAAPIPLAPPVAIPHPDSSGDTVVVQPDAPIGTAGDTILIAQDAEVPGHVSRKHAYDAPFTVDAAAAAAVAAGKAKLPQPVPHRRLETQLHTSLARLAGGGIGVRYFFKPDRFFAAAEGDLYLTPPAVSDALTIIHYETRMLTGLVAFGRPRGWFRVELSTGIGGIITTFSSPDVRPYYDWYWNVMNIQPVITTGRQRWFVRLGLNYAFETDRGFFLSGIDNNDASIQLFAGTTRSW